MENQTELNISIPEGYEIDKEQSTFEKIIFKKKEYKKEQQVKTWTDLIGKKMPNSSKYINAFSCILSGEIGPKHFNNREDRNYFIDEKHAKSALAMAQISQLMPYYGGAVTDEEWGDSTTKYIIYRKYSEIELRNATNIFHFLAFHTKEQRDSFYRYNKQLVRDYLRLD